MVQSYLHVILSGGNQEILTGLDLELPLWTENVLITHCPCKNTCSAHAPATLIKAYSDNL